MSTQSDQTKIKVDNHIQVPRLAKACFVSLGLLLAGSTPPVQASQTFKEITQPCKASEEANNACDAMAIHFSAVAYYSYLCRLEQASGVTPEILSEQPRVHGKTEHRKQIAKIAFNTAIGKIKKSYPNCSAKAIP